MRLFVVRRRATSAALRRRSAAPEADGGEPVRWIRSYVVRESDGSRGTVDVYQAPSPAAVRAHSARRGLPITELVEVDDIVLVRRDATAVEIPA
jgi:hypothetical protein